MRLAAVLEAHDRADPLRPGLSATEATQALDLPDTKILDAVLADHPTLAVRAGRVLRAGTGAPTLPPPLLRALQGLRADLRARPFAASDADRLDEPA